MERQIIEAAKRLCDNADFVRVMDHLTDNAAASLCCTDPNDGEALRDAALLHATLNDIMVRVEEIAATKMEKK